MREESNEQLENLFPKILPDYSDIGMFYHDPNIRAFFNDDHDRIMREINKRYELANKSYIEKVRAYFNSLKDEPPQSGEFLEIAGRYFRFTHDYGNKIQFYADGSYYAYTDGVSHSGTCGELIHKDRLHLNTWNGRKEGQVWTFDRGNAKGSNGIHFNVLFRVFYIDKL